MDDDTKQEARTLATTDSTIDHEASGQHSAPKVQPENIEKRVKKIIRKKRRPARPQIDASEISSEPPPQTGIIFNIWYNKWSGGDREDKYLSQTHAKGRCNISTDTGYTRADKINGSYFCLFFARGVCPKGQDCEYLHRLPGLHDHFYPNIDCFGRNKHSEYRDDMGGVGSFTRQNRTLYVGRIVVTDDIEEVVARHFQEWGEVERIRVLTGRGVAFITFLNETNAQFAKEAMAHQSLDNEEILNVRWATADPNPLAQKREARKIEEQAAEAVRRALPAEYVAEIEGREDGNIKRRRLERTFDLEGYSAPDKVWYGRGHNSEIDLGKHVGDQSVQTVSSRDTTEDAETDGLEGSTSMISGLFQPDMAAAFQRLVSSKSQAIPSNKPIGSLVGYASDEDSG